MKNDNTADRKSPAEGVGQGEAVAKPMNPQQAQKEQMADQPKNRPQTKSNPAMDKKDMGE